MDIKVPYFWILMSKSCINIFEILFWNVKPADDSKILLFNFKCTKTKPSLSLEIFLVVIIHYANLMLFLLKSDALVPRSASNSNNSNLHSWSVSWCQLPTFTTVKKKFREILFKLNVNHEINFTFYIRLLGGLISFKSVNKIVKLMVLISFITLSCLSTWWVI